MRSHVLSHMPSHERNAIVRLAPAVNHRPAITPLRLPVFVEDADEAYVLSRRLARGASPRHTRFVVFLLVPLLILQPFVRVYAQEAEVSDSAFAPEPPAASTPTVADVAEIPVESIPPDAGAGSPEPSATKNPLYEGQEEVPIDTGIDTGEVNPQSADSEMGTDENIPVGELGETENQPEDQGDGIPVDTDKEPAFEEEHDEIPSEDVVIGGETGTSTEKSASSESSEDVEETHSSDEEQAETAQVTFPESSETLSPIDVALAQREEQLRAELRREIEREYARGCVSLDGVGYYCLRPEEVRSIESLRPSASVSSVFAETDPMGSDREIYAMFAGERLQLSFNNEEDAFPTKDLAGTSVVWQGQRGGRWQIFFASFASGTPRIVQLTNAPENNFNPRVEGEMIVWQTWMDGNWDIVLARPHRGEPRRAEDLPEMNRLLGVSPDWDITRVSMDPAHDMFPALAGGIVTWQRAESGGWSLFAYSPETNIETRVSDPGKKSENARFTLVYEEEDEGGFRRMVGYDVATGEHIDLTEEARRVPDRGAPYVPQVPVEGSDQAALPSLGGASVRTTEETSGEPDAPSSNDL